MGTMLRYFGRIYLSVLEVFFIYGTLNLTFLHYITLAYYCCPIEFALWLKILKVTTEYLIFAYVE